MTEFSVGDRVLVPGVVERVTDGQRPGVRIPGLSGALLAIDPTHLRPDTGGRDLTVQDLRAAYKAWNDQHPGWGDVVERERFIPEYLTRIARGDAGSAGDDTAPPAESDQVLAFAYGGGRNGKVRCPCGHVGMSHGDNEAAARAGKKQDPCRLCPCIGFRILVPDPTAAAGPRAGDEPDLAAANERARHDAEYRATWHAIATGLALKRHPSVIASDALAAAGPRAGDTAPDDEPNRMERHELVAEVVRLRSEVAALRDERDQYRALADVADPLVQRARDEIGTLRDAGDSLAALVQAMLTGPVPEPGDWWPCLAPRVAAWRSAAGEATT